MSEILTIRTFVTMTLWGGQHTVSFLLIHTPLTLVDMTLSPNTFPNTFDERRKRLTRVSCYSDCLLRNDFRHSIDRLRVPFVYLLSTRLHICHLWGEPHLLGYHLPTLGSQI